MGLDPDPQVVPDRYGHLGDRGTGLLKWNQTIIQETADLVCAYKPNIAFYEALGIEGLALLSQTLHLIPDHIPVILDAKRGDIGNTAAAYAKACFDDWRVDAVTLSPYLGRDSVEPFIRYPDKGLFVLCHTSNPGAEDFQHLEVSDWRSLDREGNQPLYVHVARSVPQWAENIGLVVGATYPGQMAAIRQEAPDTWILAPGIGTQGGNLKESVAAGLRQDGSGLIVNVGRQINQADSHAEMAQSLRDAINEVRREVIVA